MDEYLGEITRTHIGRTRISQIHIFIDSCIKSCYLIDTVTPEIKLFFNTCRENAEFRDYYFTKNKIVVYQYFSFIKYILREYPKLFVVAFRVFDLFKCMIARVRNVSPNIMCELYITGSLNVYNFEINAEDNVQFLKDAGFELGEHPTSGNSKMCYIHHRI